jgi:Cdc6-like AAA superfamily ATPase
LNWIDSRQNHWRYEGVDKAYQQTYEWLFQSPTGSQTWDSFSDHLKSDVNGPCFINGKAGSGKSTLMKFVYDHVKTKEALRQCAGSQELVMTLFFFWNLGTTLQKTHAGMLREILSTILDKHPELIPAVFSKFYRNWKNWDFKIEPHYVEIKEAFSIMIEKSSYLKLAVFIDGIDEFEGDHRDMVQFLRSLASPRVKLVISSRPLNTCLASLTGCPTLRVQDLTRNDMKVFVDANSRHII